MLVLELALAVAALMAIGWVISACVCGCRNTHQKSELVGTAGVVKLRFDEEIPSPTPTTPASVKRASTQNSQRSLPEIPQPVGRHDSADTASDLIYATVNIDGVGPVKTEPTPSTSRDHSYEHAYAKVQNETLIHIEHPSEQAAAAVPDVAIIEPQTPSQSALESVVISAGVAISGQLPSSQELPYITPPSPHPPPAPDVHPPHAPQPQHFSGDSTDSTKGYTSISVREPLSNIRAILTQSNKTQQHYATVSDDSDEMYAAIDDRDGSAHGSETYAQIAPQPELRPAVEARPQENRLSQELRQERHSQERDVTRNALMQSEAGSRRSAPPEIAAVVSNHSRQDATSTAESASSCSNSVGTLGSPKPEKRQANSPLPPPPPPVGDGKERRKHDSPLTHTISQQQRISSTGDLHLSHDKHRRSLNEKHQRNNSCVSSSDFYGCNYPVEKHRFSSGDIIRPLVAKELNFNIDKPSEHSRLHDNLYNSIDGPSCSDYSSAEANISLTSDRVTESPSRNVEEMYAKVMKKTKSKLHQEELKSARKLVYANDNAINETNTERNPHRFTNDDPGYETIDRKQSVGHGYETITEKVRKISQNQDPGYETVRDIGKNLNANFSNNNLLSKFNHLPLDSGPNSILSSDPGYEHIAKSNNCPSDSDPNYEVLRNEPPTPPYATIAPNYNIQPTYSVINKNRSTNNNDDTITEPNYESMPHDAIYTTGSESDPNYESVRPKDPNYESVGNRDPNYESLRLKNKDPNYESVRSKDRFDPGRAKHPPYESVKDPNYESVSSKDPNYESVKYMEMNKEPPYASVAGEDNAKNLHRSDSAAGYERIKPITKSSINGEGANVDDYFQV